MEFVVCWASGHRILFIARHLRFVALLCAMVFLVGAPGCTKNGGKLSVKGHVTYRGEAIERASLTFFPDVGRPEATSVQNGDYAIELSPGNYTAVILIGVDLPKGYKEGDVVPPPKIVLPEEYTSRTKSTLKATVSAGQSEPIDFALK